MRQLPSVPALFSMLALRCIWSPRRRPARSSSAGAAIPLRARALDLTMRRAYDLTAVFVDAVAIDPAAAARALLGGPPLSAAAARISTPSATRTAASTSATTRRGWGGAGNEFRQRCNAVGVCAVRRALLILCCAVAACTSTRCVSASSRDAHAVADRRGPAGWRARHHRERRSGHVGRSPRPAIKSPAMPTARVRTSWWWVRSPTVRSRPITVPDRDQATAYVATVQQVSDRTTYLLLDPVTYHVAIAP